MRKPHRSFFLLTTAIFGAILLPTLFKDGMFTDGILYAAVSKNLAHNIGTFWEPHFSSTVYPQFHEQPPLMFFLQSLFFRAFGDAFYTERIYCTVFVLINALLIVRTWKLVCKDKSISWFPVFLWLLIPQTIYAFTNNVEECTMSVFTLAAALNFVRGIRAGKYQLLYFLLAGIFLVCAGMTKGLQGLFLLGGPFFWWICMRDSSFLKMMLNSLKVFIVPAAFSVFVFLYEPARNSFAAYFRSRLSITFNHYHDCTSSHFFILGQLLLFLAPAIALALIFYFTGKKSGPGLYRKMALFFLFCGLAGTLPLMITLEQRPFYMTTALPFFALSFALYAHRGAERISLFISQRKLLGNSIGLISGAAVIGIICAVIFSCANHTIKRDKDIIHDLAAIEKITGENVTIRTTPELWSNWGLQNYAMRYHGFNFEAGENSSSELFLAEKTDLLPEGYRDLLPTGSTERFRLLKRISAEK